jgi:DNA-3-methyladenine glycosylase
VETAHARRGPAVRHRDLARGPARLCEALGIDGRLDGADLLSGQAIRLAPGAPAPADRVAAGPRVGVRHAADRPWRFWIAGDPHVSAYRPGGRVRRGDAGGSGA